MCSSWQMVYLDIIMSCWVLKWEFGCADWECGAQISLWYLLRTKLMYKYVYEHKNSLFTRHSRLQEQKLISKILFSLRNTFVRFEILTKMLMIIKVLWGFTLCSVTNNYQPIWGACCQHRQGLLNYLLGTALPLYRTGISLLSRERFLYI